MKLVSDQLVNEESGLKAGVMVGNSEVGAHSVSVEPFVFRLACTNDLIVTEERIFRHAHLRVSQDKLTHGLTGAISKAFAAC